jgi:hypothetical protein
MVLPGDFPISPFERSVARVQSCWEVRHPDEVGQMVGAWSALSYRFLAHGDEGEAFNRSIMGQNAFSSHKERYKQERYLFGFFSNGFAAFESYFYGMYSIGAVLNPTHFPFATPKDRQGVSPTSTERAYAKAFPGDPLLNTYRNVFADIAYQELREIRNVLTHRTAPGRTIFVGVGSDEPMAPRWKLNNISLDGSTVQARRAHTSRLLTAVLAAGAAFVDAHVH